MRFDMMKLLGIAPSTFSFGIDYTGLPSSFDIFNAIGEEVIKRASSNSARINDKTIRSFLIGATILEQSLANFRAVEADLNAGNDPELLEIFTQATKAAAERLSNQAAKRFAGDFDPAQQDDEDEEDCSTCTVTGCPSHPSHDVATAVAAPVASAETEDDDVRFIDEKEDAETAGARRLDFSELLAQLQGIISMLEKSGAQIHAIRVAGNSSH